MVRYLYEPTTVTPHGRDPYPLPKELHSQVLGGEAACWGRCVSSTQSLEAYFYVPTAAIAGRLWEEQGSGDLVDAKHRLERLLERVKGSKWATKWLAFHERERDNDGRDLLPSGSA